MKVLVAARLFSGLASSLRDAEWRPTGVPAIYKLLEGLAADPDIDLMTLAAVKDPMEPWAWGSRRIEMAPIGQVELLGWRERDWLKRLRLAGLLREARQTAQFLWRVLRWRPDVVYVTNANFPMGAMCAYLRLAPVVVRFLGIHPVQKRLAEGRGGLQRQMYKAPFALAVCSRDGSGGEVYLPRLLSTATPLRVLLNGVDPLPDVSERAHALRARLGLGDRPLVLFVGRLEPNKGVLEFVEAVERVLAQRPDAFDAVVVGDGSLATEARQRARSSRLHVVGPAPHEEVAAYLQIADIFVSLNRFGSLSNANLEAARAGLCLIALEPDPKDATDIESLAVFSEGDILRIARDEPTEPLVQALKELVDLPERVRWYKARAAACAERFQPWSTRIAQEIDLIKSASLSGEK